MKQELITTFDLFYSSFIIIILIVLSTSKAKSKRATEPYYKNYTKGLIIKIFGGVIFCLIYALYYGGGDTVNYYKGVDSFIDVFLDSPYNYFKALFTEDGPFSRNLFIKVNNFPPPYMIKDTRTYTVIKLSSFFALFGFGGFLATTIIISYFIYQWVWKLYGFMYQRYPHLERAINWSVLYIPSTIFWGSGIMKDTFTFGDK